MEFAPLLFTACLLLVGVLCILAVKRRMAEAAFEERRRQLGRWNAVAVQKQQTDKHRRKVWSAIETAYIKFNEKANNGEPQPEQEEEPAKQLDPWADLCPSQINAAFDKFMLQKPQAPPKAMHAHAASFHSRRQHQSL